MTQPQITRALSRLSNLACALEDYQAFMEAGEGDNALVSRGMCADNIDGIRYELLSLERSIGITAGAELPAVPDRASDDWDSAA